ncbi:hypothetical protein M409DRAFT_51403 [Zasmidium cellare ATCC 36951]|uniref:Uncharacterized protein n=1 Tax=Zasmidium cellare ATCC 36951 TaxID=1080233 RepID=A0A6A6CVX3_ZASCE|nr:uncharacterized protein M409DRAFT_51403 [Zasmidium cellare ATCC 36951]KAF2170350.1 hypothetical protein M409DRAFT_51403 [Zasmidium cellare ATCC 36951]
MPPARRTLSRRNVRGRGYAKRGYRQNGELSFQLKRSYAHFSRQMDINENETISEPIRAMFHSVENEDPGWLPEGLHFAFVLRRQVLVPSEDMVKTLFDGGETLSAKVLNDDGVEYEWDDGSVFTPKPRREGRNAGAPIYDFRGS